MMNMGGMQGGCLGKPEPIRETAASQYFELLRRVNEQAMKAVSFAKDRLSPVCLPDNVKPGGMPRAEEERLVPPLFEDLRNVTKNIESSISEIVEILSRVDL